MSLQSENRSQKMPQRNSAIAMLTQKNAESIRRIELTPYEVQVYAIPVEQRNEERNLLEAAAEFQPELYKMIRQLSTRDELEDYVSEIQNIEADYMENTVAKLRKANEEMMDSIRQTISQDGKAREDFISKCSSELGQNRQRIENTITALRRKILWLMISTSAAAIALSVLVCVVFWKLAA